MLTRGFAVAVKFLSFYIKYFGLRLIDFVHFLFSRWENMLQYTQSRLVPKFTPLGFKVVSTPPEVHERLVEAVSQGVANFDELRTEGDIDVIYDADGLAPKFVDIHGLAWDTINILKSMHEEWGGMELIPTSAYGVRLYQNESSLVMHYDRVSATSLHFTSPPPPAATSTVYLYHSSGYSPF